jgi:hypothetical protein
MYQRQRSHSNSSSSSHSSTSHHHALKKIFHTLSSKKQSNADKLEFYLHRCLNDVNIKSCSLLKEFLQPQREEDHIIPKHQVQSYVQQSMENNYRHDNDLLTVPRQVIQNNLSDISSIRNLSAFDVKPSEESIASVISSHLPVTIQDFQFIKVIGRGCMGKVIIKIRKRITC